MKKLITTSGIAFEIDWAAPVDITENIVFLAKIHGSDIDTIHNRTVINCIFQRFQLFF